MHTLLTVLRTPGPLRRFLLAYLFSQVGGSMAYVAVLIVGLERSGGSGWGVTAVLLAELLPMVLVSNLAGRLADTRSRRTILVAADAIGVAGFAGLAFFGDIYLTVFFTALAGCGLALFMPASKSAIGAMSGTRAGDAMGVSVTMYSTALLAGPAIGAGLLLFLTPEWLLVVNALTFSVSGLVIWRLPLDRGGRETGAPHSPPLEGNEFAIEEDRRSGWAIVRGHSILRLVIGAVCGSALTAAIINVAEPLLATGSLDAGAAGFSAMIAAFGIGGVIGSFWSRASVPRLAAVVACTGVSLILIGASPSLWFVLPLMVAFGCCEGMVSSGHQRMFANLATENELGRVFGFKHSLEAGCIIAGNLIGGGMAASLDPRTVFAVSGILTIACAAAVYLGYRVTVASEKSAESSSRSLSP